MKYFEFEESLSRKLKNETIVFDVEGLLNDLAKHKEERKLIFWVWPIGLLSILYLFIFFFDNSQMVYSNTELKNSVVEQNGNNNSLFDNTYGLIKEVSIGEVSVNEVSADEIFMDEVSTVKTLNEISLLKENGAKTNSVFTFAEQKRIDNSFKLNLKPDVKRMSFLHNNKSINLTENINDQTLETTITTSRNLKQHSTFLLPLATLEKITNLDMVKSNYGIESRFLGNNNVDCPSFANPDKNSGIEIVAELGVFKPIKSLTNISGEANVLTTLRQENEKPLIGMQAGLYLKYNLNRSPFYLFGGANYSKFTEKMELDFVVTEIDTTIDLVSITESELGDTITYIYGEVYSETTTKGRKTRHYSISSFDIPLHVGYELDLDNISIGVELGVALNISLISNGQFLSSQSDFLDLGEENTFKNNVGLRYDSKVFAAYKISPRQKIYASVGLSTTPQSFLKPEAKTNQLYKSVGFNIGYGFSF